MAECASREPRYYTLSTTSDLLPVATETVNQKKAPLWIAVSPVQVPERLNRTNLILGQGGGSQRVLEHDRWLAPLPDEFRDALSAQLQSILGAVDTYQQDAGRTGPAYRINVRIVRLDAELDGQVSALVSWTVRQSPSGTTRTGQTRAVLGSPGGVERIVAAYQQLVMNTAYDISGAVRSFGP
ncbi:PqiC family protein [Cupriavidus pauculus]|nr:PqiC family protein [Cupriavidus pauculus]